MEREAEFQAVLTGSSLMAFDIDDSELGIIKPEDIIQGRMGGVTLYSQRQMCSVCGEIVSKRVPICPYCGSRVFVSREETP